MNILVTGAWKFSQENINSIKDLGHKICIMQQESDGLPCDPEWVEGIICNGLFLHHEISQFINLKYIQLTSAGFDRVPLEYIKARNIVINNARGVYSIPMAEFAVSGVLQVYKKSRFFYENQKKCIWEKNRNLQELYGKTVCIIGCGSVGTECARRFRTFGCKIIGIDLKPYKSREYDEMLCLDEIYRSLRESDIIILTIPLTDQTYHLFDYKAFDCLKDYSVLVNISRGKVIDTAALIKKLDDRSFNAVLDVFEDEPLPSDSPVWEKDNIIITPHNSFIGDGNNLRLSNLIINNLIYLTKAII